MRQCVLSGTFCACLLQAQAAGMGLLTLSSVLPQDITDKANKKMLGTTVSTTIVLAALQPTAHMPTAARKVMQEQLGTHERPFISEQVYVAIVLLSHPFLCLCIVLLAWRSIHTLWTISSLCKLLALARHWYVHRALRRRHVGSSCARRLRGGLSALAFICEYDARSWFSCERGKPHLCMCAYVCVSHGLCQTAVARTW